MRTLSELLREADEGGARLDLDVQSVRRVPADLGVVFHVPLIAVAILVTANQEKAKLTTGEISRWVAGVLSEHCFGATDAIRRYQWSMVLRERAAEALVFLESSGFVNVSEGDPRVVKLSAEGSKLLSTAKRSQDRWGALVRDLIRSHTAAQARGLVLL